MVERINPAQDGPENNRTANLQRIKTGVRPEEKLRLALLVALERAVQPAVFFALDARPRQKRKK